MRSSVIPQNENDRITPDDGSNKINGKIIIWSFHDTTTGVGGLYPVYVMNESRVYTNRRTEYESTILTGE